MISPSSFFRHHQHSRTAGAVAAAVAPLAVLFGLAGCQSTAPSESAPSAQTVGVAAPALKGLAAYDYNTSFAPLDELDAAVAAAGKDPEKIAALVGRLTEILRQPEATFAARQAVCQRLGYLLAAPGGAALAANDPTLAVLRPWLEDAKLCQLALLALERVPGSAVDQLLQSAAKRINGPARQALLGALNRRHPDEAAPSEPPPSLAAMIDNLGGSNMLRKEQALQLLAAAPASSAAPAIAAKLASWNPESQAAALVLLGRLGHASAVPAVITATSHADVSVRMAAIDTLGKLPGSEASARRLLEIISGSNIDETKAAFLSMARLDGAGISSFLLKGAGDAENPNRIACIRSLASRNAVEALPFFHQSRKDSSVEVRCAALDALNDIAPFSEQAAVLEWAFHAEDNQEIGRAQRALVAITQRAPVPAEGIRSLLAALETASPAAKARHARILARLGDSDSLACAARLAMDPNTEVATAALSALTRWPTQAALAPLCIVATQSPDARLRDTAITAAADLAVKQHGFLSSAQAGPLVKILSTVTDTAQRRTLLSALARAADEGAAKAAANLASAPDIGAEALQTAELIRANLRWPPSFKASGDQANLRLLVDRREKTRWSVPASAGEWLEIDFKAERPLRRLVLDRTGRANDAPGKCEVLTGSDAAQLSKSSASVSSSGSQTVVEFPAGTRLRIVRLQLTATREGGTWSVVDLRVE